MGFDGYFETSAKEGWQIKELSAAVVSAIPWDTLPRVASSRLFQNIKDFLVGEKAAGRILSTADDLYRAFPNPADVSESTPDLRMQFETCIGRVESRGLIKRLSFGDLVLLQPEMLDSYASGLVNAARTEPDGLGTIREDYAREGRFAMAQDERIKDAKQEKLLLIATIEDLLRHEIGLREGEDLVFPAQFTREHPELPDPEGKAVMFQFDGSAQTIYTTLAVRLAHSGMFQTQEMWRNAAVYSFAGERCGMFLREPEEGKGELTLFFNPGATPVTKHQFEEFVFTHLRRRALPESVKRRRVIGCPKCGGVITDRQSQARLALGKTTISCPVCETEFCMLEKEEPSERVPAGLRNLDLMADSRRDYAAAKSILDGKISTNDFDVFLCHRTEDKSAIRRIGETLKSVGLLPWLDEWELPPGKPWQPALEKSIKEIRSAAIFVGPSGLGPWQDLEQQAFLREFVRRGCPVIPVILPGCAQKPELPVFLSGMQWVDFREEDPNPLERLIWGITGKRPGGEADITYALVSNFPILELLQQIQGDQDRESAKRLHQEANTEYSKGNYREAERLYNESLPIERKLGDQSAIAATLHQLANIEYSREKYPKAKKLYEDAKGIFEKLGDQSGIAATLEQMGRTAEEEGEFKLAKKHYQQALEIFEKLEEKPNIEIAKKNLERIQKLKQKP